MREEVGDLLDPPDTTFAICVPTNGMVKRHAAVMGAGLAKLVRDRWENIDYVLGYHLERTGNHVRLLTHAVESERIEVQPPCRKGARFHIVAFPTKNHWKAPASLDLIRRSAHELAALFPPAGRRVIALPRVGCGLGGLSWDAVKPILEEILPGERYVVLHKE